MAKRIPNLFLIVWDNLGLECCISLSEIEKQNIAHAKEAVWRTLAAPDGEDKAVNPAGVNINELMQNLLLRAQANTHRHYEIYTIQATKEITQKDLEDMFEATPQAAADLIRERGNKVYSNRARPGEIKII